MNLWTEAYLLIYIESKQCYNPAIRNVKASKCVPLYGHMDGGDFDFEINKIQFWSLEFQL